MNDPVSEAQGPHALLPILAEKGRPSAEKSKIEMTTGTSSQGQLGEDFHLEIIEAHEAGFEIEQYIRCRNAGVTHAEALEVHRAEVLPSFYLDARSEDFAHSDALIFAEARFREGDFDGFHKCFAYGIPHDDLMYLAARVSNFDSVCIDLTEGGVTVSEHVEAYELGFDSVDYGEARDNGVTHEEMVDLASIGGWTEWYLDARMHGWNHLEAAQGSRKARKSCDRGGEYICPEDPSGAPGRNPLLKQLFSQYPDD
jgi:hypothetical protein